jgi:flagellar motor switch/type III secretory pathway protein FliN
VDANLPRFSGLPVDRGRIQHDFRRVQAVEKLSRLGDAPRVRTVSAYPWQDLPRFTRDSLRDVSRARHLLDGISLELVAKAVGELTSSAVAIVPRKAGASGSPGPDAIALSIGDARVIVGIEPALVSLALSRILGRPAGIDPRPELDPTLRGALAAVLVEVARRSGAGQPIAVLESARREGLVRLEATLSLDSRPFAVSVWVLLAPVEAARPTLGDVPALVISLPLVVAVSLASRDDIASLAVGDAWLPTTWTMDARGVGSAVLAAPSHDSGVAVDLAPQGSIVVGERALFLGVEAEPMGERSSIEDAALDAPIVVRVEVGAVSMTAAEWARLRAGDVIETGRRVNEPVVLRVAGREVARGELCDVEGELGVRIRELASGESK